MSETFEVISFFCNGKDNETVDELEDNVEKSLIYDPETNGWYLGEWTDE